MLNNAVQELLRGHSNNHSTPSYDIVEIPAKGKGVVATRSISRAEVLMSDTAVVLLDLSFPRAVQQQNGYELLHLAAEQLSDPDRVLELDRSSTKAADIIEDIIGTNSFSYTLGGDPHMALYPEVSVSPSESRLTWWLVCSRKYIENQPRLQTKVSPRPPSK
jgi:hypothetical protein